MPLINCKVELKLKWNCVLAATSADNTNVNRNNIIFTIKDTKSYVPVATLSAKGNEIISEILSKGFERSVYWNEYKTKRENKSTTNEYRHFFESNFVGVNRLFMLISLNRDNDVNRWKAQRYYLPGGIIKNYKSSSTERTFMTIPLILI